MPIPQYRIFFDTSTYIAALISPKGAAGELIRLVEVGVLRMVVSKQVIIEADKVLADRFPELIQENRRLWKHLSPEIAPDGTINQCSAHLAKVAVFVTWNTRDFMGHNILSLVDFPIVVQGDALKLFRKWIEPFLE
jgi:hypothetical protein